MLFLLFELDQDSYAIATSRIAAVLPMLDAKQLPAAHPAVFGLIDYCALIVPVIDVAALALGRPSHARVSTRIILVHYRDQQAPGRLLGLLLERATDMLRGNPGAFQPSGVASGEAPYLGQVLAGPRGLVQEVSVDELLSPALSALLFPESSAS